MSLAVSTTNALETIGASGLASVTPASGYALSDLYTGGPAQSFTTASAASIHAIDIHTNAQTFDCLALFGVKAAGATVTSILLERSGSWPLFTVTTIGSFSLNSAGGGAWLKSVGSASTQTVRINVMLSASAVLSVGQVWLGTKTTISKMHTRERPTKHSNAIANVSELRSVKTARLAAPTTDLSLEFSPVTSAESTELESAWDALTGNFRPVVLIPDTTATTRVFYGRLSEAQGWERDPSGFRFGHVLDFAEEGRASA